MSLDRAIIRQARQSDAEGVARVHLASSEESYAPLAREWPAQDLATRTKRWAALLQVADRVELRGSQMATFREVNGRC
jgi:hypothetical protein